MNILDCRLFCNYGWNVSFGYYGYIYNEEDLIVFVFGGYYKFVGGVVVKKNKMRYF